MPRSPRRSPLPSVLTGSTVVALGLMTQVATLGVGGSASAAASPELAADPAAAQHAAAIAGLLDDIEANYAYFDELVPAWPRLREHYIAEASAASSRFEVFRIAERLLEELTDDHAQLNSNAADSRRPVPSLADVWPVWDAGRVVIESVRPGSNAESAGLIGGDLVTAINGIPAADAVRTRIPRFADPSDPRVLGWATRAVVTGARDAPVRLSIARGEHQFDVEFVPGDAGNGDPVNNGPITTSRPVPGVALVRINNALGQTTTIAAFDTALDQIAGVEALVIDLRDTPGGGNTTVARGIMSRLISETAAYQVHDIPAEERAFGVQRRWAEQVVPRDPSPPPGGLAVIVGRWTGSMGEGLAIGLRDAAGATIIGTEMAGLRGSIRQFPVGDLGFAASIPTEWLFAITGEPRERTTPCVFVDPAGLTAAEHDARALVAALSALGESQR